VVPTSFFGVYGYVSSFVVEHIPFPIWVWYLASPLDCTLGEPYGNPRVGFLASMVLNTPMRFGLDVSLTLDVHACKTTIHDLGVSGLICGSMVVFIYGYHLFDVTNTGLIG